MKKRLGDVLCEALNAICEENGQKYENLVKLVNTAGGSFYVTVDEFIDGKLLPEHEECELIGFTWKPR